MRHTLALLASAALILAAGAQPGCSCDNSGSAQMDFATDDGGGDDLSMPGNDLAVQGCGLVTCASMNAACGPIGDGCGGMLDCGKCAAPTTCGGGGTPFQCGGTAQCVPVTCAQLSLSCGPSGDGCGGKLDCGMCMNGETCGGGGVNGKCGAPSSPDLAGPDGGTSLCVPKTCASLGFGCGMAGDGCGNVLDCGTCTVAGQTCGGGGVPFQCGAPVCTKLTCAGLGFNCGPAGDGCGGMLDCGTCMVAGQSCGAGGKANVCGSPACVPKSCAMLGYNCGMAGNGCGQIQDCGSCMVAGQTCGGAGTPNVCGAPMCTPKTCAQLGYNCGQAGDGCGNLIAGGCGTCPMGQLCGVVSPNVCGQGSTGGTNQCDGGATTISGTVVAPTDPTQNFGNPDPIYNAIVFVPSGTPQPITTGATCEQCSMGQPAIVQTTTGVDGKFVLTNPPTGAAVTVVIQLGKWRRVITVPVMPCVDNPLTLAQTRLPRKQNEFNQYDNIPRFAVDTGDVDVLECVLRKMGIADSEFVNPNLDASGVPQATGRVQLYKGGYMSTNGAGGAIIDANTPQENSLWGNQKTLNSYDAVLFPCEGGQDDEQAADQARVVEYANKGGRVFATHFSYVWLYNNTSLGVTAPLAPATWQSTATWSINSGTTDPAHNGLIDFSFPKGLTLSQWLAQPQVVGPTTMLSAALTAGATQVNAPNAAFTDIGRIKIDNEIIWYNGRNNGRTRFNNAQRGQDGTAAAAHANGAGVVQWAEIPVSVIRNDFSAVGANAQRWMYVQNAVPGNGPGDFPIHYTFNTPVGATAANQCGRVVYSDFHVETTPYAVNQGSANGVTFPTECNGNAPMTPQEKLLEFMLFDLTSCVSPDVPTCTPKSCAQLGFNCGMQGDGCGGTQDCGMCPTGQVCGGGGMPGVCSGGCTPKTCAQLGFNCGMQGNGCGGTQDCGTCTPPMSCGGGGTPGVCGGGCIKQTCAGLGASCGVQSDGCGGSLMCGTCTPPQTCGGGGMPNQCGGGCMPLTCAKLGLMCGPAGDGCGGTLSCGTCPAGQTCGGGGAPGVCGAPPDGGPACVPTTCAAQGFMCGFAGDGCGNLLDCGMCPPGQTCGGGGMHGVCGAPNCTKRTCSQVIGVDCTNPANHCCGVVGDGCGGTLSCGTCMTPDTCGGANMANICGHIG